MDFWTIAFIASRGLIFLVGAAIVWRRSKAAAGAFVLLATVAALSVLNIGQFLEFARIVSALVLTIVVTDLVGRATALANPYRRD